MDSNTFNDYVSRITPLLPLAKRAYGAKDQNTPAHHASREYTRLLVEYNDAGGNLVRLASAIGVAYSGVRRRVFTADVPPVKTKRMSRSSLSVSTISDAADRVRAARAIGTAEYHAQLHEEYYAGIPMNMLARELGISNAGPLYYAVQRHYKRQQVADAGLAAGDI
jgi:transposase-like protein